MSDVLPDEDSIDWERALKSYVIQIMDDVRSAETRGFHSLATRRLTELDAALSQHRRLILTNSTLYCHLRSVVLNNLAMLYRRKGKYNLALRHLEAIYGLENDISGNVTSNTLLNLCALCSLTGQHERAMLLARRTLEELEARNANPSTHASPTEDILKETDSSLEYHTLAAAAYHNLAMEMMHIQAVSDRWTYNSAAPLLTVDIGVDSYSPSHEHPVEIGTPLLALDTPNVVSRVPVHATRPGSMQQPYQLPLTTGNSLASPLLPNLARRSKPPADVLMPNTAATSTHKITNRMLPNIDRNSKELDDPLDNAPESVISVQHTTCPSIMNNRNITVGAVWPTSCLPTDLHRPRNSTRAGVYSTNTLARWSSLSSQPLIDTLPSSEGDGFLDGNLSSLEWLHEVLRLCDCAIHHGIIVFGSNGDKIHYMRESRKKAAAMLQIHEQIAQATKRQAARNKKLKQSNQQQQQHVSIGSSTSKLNTPVPPRLNGIEGGTTVSPQVSSDVTGGVRRPHPPRGTPAYYVTLSKEPHFSRPPNITDTGKPLLLPGLENARAQPPHPRKPQKVQSKDENRPLGSSILKVRAIVPHSPRSQVHIPHRIKPLAEWKKLGTLAPSNRAVAMDETSSFVASPHAHTTTSGDCVGAPDPTLKSSRIMDKFQILCMCSEAAVVIQRAYRRYEARCEWDRRCDAQQKAIQSSLFLDHVIFAQAMIRRFLALRKR